MTRKASVVIEKDEHGYYAWCPELTGCQSQGAGLEEAIANIREAIELYFETLTEVERSTLSPRAASRFRSTEAPNSIPRSSNKYK